MSQHLKEMVHLQSNQTDCTLLTGGLQMLKVILLGNEWSEMDWVELKNYKD